MNRILSLLSTKQPPAQGELTVEGMTCGGCARRVESLLSRTAGVQEARVDLAARRVSVGVDPMVCGSSDRRDEPRAAAGP